MSFMSGQYSAPTITQQNSLPTVETWHPIPGYPELEASDMGRIRCIVPKRTRPQAPFILSQHLRYGRPIVGVGQGKSRRVDELVMEAWGEARPAPDHGVVPKNGDKEDCRLDNLEWRPGVVQPANQIGVTRKRIGKKKPQKKAKKTQPTIPSTIRHVHGLTLGNVSVWLQPNHVIELEVGEDCQPIEIPEGDLATTIRLLQAAQLVASS